MGRVPTQTSRMPNALANANTHWLMEIPSPMGGSRWAVPTRRSHQPTTPPSNLHPLVNGSTDPTGRPLPTPDASEVEFGWPRLRGGQGASVIWVIRVDIGPEWNGSDFRDREGRGVFSALGALSDASTHWPLGVNGRAGVGSRPIRDVGGDWLMAKALANGARHPGCVAKGGG
jgi:hypothetical protein